MTQIDGNRDGLPELKRAYARFRLNPNRVKRVWDELDDARRNELVRQATGNDPTGRLIAGDDGIGERETTAGMRKLLQRFLAEAEFVCRWWAKLFGGIDRVTDERVRIMLKLTIDDGFSAEDLVWAARAYREYVSRDDWHRRESAAGRPCTKSIERFFYDERLNQWVLRGRELSGTAVQRELVNRFTRDDRQKRAENIKTHDALMQRFSALPSGEQQRLVSGAVDYLKARAKGKMMGSPTIANPLVRGLVLKALQREVPAPTAMPLGDAVQEALGGNV